MELLCKSPALKPERRNQVVAGLQTLPASRVVPPALTALAQGRLAPETTPAVERLLVELGRKGGVEHLLDVVRTDEEVWEVASGLVGQLASPTTLPALLELLGEKDPGLRRWTRGALRAYPPRQTVPLLLQVLEGGGNQRLGALEALGTIRHPQALEPLVKLLGKARGPLVEALKAALARYGELAHTPLLEVMAKGQKRERELALAILDSMGELPLPVRVKRYLLLDEEDALLSLGAAALETLLEALAWEDPRRRYLAARVLAELAGGLADKGPVKRALEGLLADGDPPVRHAALEGLSRLREAGSLEALHRGLADPHDEVARTAAEGLARLGPEGVRALVASLESESVKVRQRVGRALLELGVEAVEPLWAAYQQSRPDLSLQAAILLQRLPELDLARRLRLLLARGESGAVVKLAPEVLPHLSEALGDSDPQIQKTATRALKALGADAVEPLVTALGGTDLRRRQAALQTLVEMGQPALEGLLAGLEGPNPRLRRDSALALGELGQGQALKPLAKALKDPETRVAQEAAQALVKLAAPGLRALGRSGSPLAAQPLQQVLVDDPSLAMEAARALAQLGPAAREPLEAALNHVHSSVRALAAEALGQVRQKASVPALAQTLADEETGVREAARGGLVSLGPVALPALCSCLSDPHWYVRREAAQALGEIGDPKGLTPLVEGLADSDREVQAAAAQALLNFKGEAITPLVEGLEAAPDKELRLRRGLLKQLGRDHLEALFKAYHQYEGAQPLLEPLLMELAPKGWVGERLEELGDLEAAREWYVKTGCQDRAQGLNEASPPALPASEKEGPQEPEPSHPEQPAVAPGGETVPDLSMQLERLIQAHEAGHLTAEEFAKAKARLLAS